MHVRTLGFAATVLAVGVNLVGAVPAATADPATELPDRACNDGTKRAFDLADENANSPVLPHGNHGCHVHLPPW